VTFGWLTKRALPDELVDSWLVALRSDAGVRRDLRRYATGARKRHMIDICRRLPWVNVPTLVVWTPEDRISRPEHGERLAALIPGSRLELVADSY
jgi:pimeloyl-ACP methyl ester carboxylesterase